MLKYSNAIFYSPEILVYIRFFQHVFVSQCGKIDEINMGVENVKPKGDKEKTFFKCYLIKFSFSTILMITCLLFIPCLAVQ